MKKSFVTSVGPTLLFLAIGVFPNASHASGKIEIQSVSEIATDADDLVSAAEDDCVSTEPIDVDPWLKSTQSESDRLVAGMHRLVH